MKVKAITVVTLKSLSIQGFLVEIVAFCSSQGTLRTVTAAAAAEVLLYALQPGFDGVDCFLSLDTIAIPNNLMNKHERCVLHSDT